MFLVTDSLDSRQRKVLSFLEDGEPAIAVLLAAADCERTIRRAIMTLGETSTKELAHRLGRPRPEGSTQPTTKPPKYSSSIDGYAKAWGVELRRFDEPLLDGVVGSKATLKKAFQLRHDLVHGDRGTTGAGYARAQVERLLEATRRVSEFAQRHGANLEQPIQRRLKPRCASVVGARQIFGNS